MGTTLLFVFSDCEDFWDCSSNEDNSDADSEDEQAVDFKRHAYTKHVASFFAKFFGDLPNVVDSSIIAPIHSGPIEESKSLFIFI